MPLLISNIYELPHLYTYLVSRKLMIQYKKAKSYILAGKFRAVQFKKRNPKSSNVWYFRINKQFRAIGFIRENTFFVVEIDNHQN